jgi:2',3'-cyclic-nucleotide 2'-phosphodiesterase (5'-nucleotidase family)
MRAKNEGGSILPVQASTTISVGGLTVSIFGVTVPMVTERMAAKAMSAFLFDDPVTVARKQVANLRYNADILIALTHIGIAPDRNLPRRCRAST